MAGRAVIALLALRHKFACRAKHAIVYPARVLIVRIRHTVDTAITDGAWFALHAIVLPAVNPPKAKMCAQSLRA